jgi:uncharacterized Zn-finger protein
MMHEHECIRCPEDGDHETDHPVVYLSMTKEGVVKCPYCGKVFTNEEEV